ncbi:MAG: OmpA/MotB family protein [Candidatus Latescibacterota bacterium]
MPKKKQEENKPGAPLWVLTYGDCMSLLLCFFVMLQAYSTLEMEKFNQAMASLKGALGVLPYQQSSRPSPVQPQAPSKGEKKGARNRRARAVSSLRQVVRERNLSSIIKVRESEGGIHVTIGDPALFESGRAEIKPDILPVLTKLVEVINTGEENIRVEGHTDNIPIHTGLYEDNWELSIARAMSVIRYVRSRGVVDPRRLRPVGCGEFHPVASNESAEGRALNRRVEIYIDMGG